MVAYSFQRQFAAPILDRTKIGTIRLPRKGRCRHARAGDALQLFTGMRTKVCCKVATATCVETLPLWVVPGDDNVLYPLENRRLLTVELDRFAIEDGFGDWADFRAFWQIRHPDAPESPAYHIIWGQSAVAANADSAPSVKSFDHAAELAWHL